MPEPGRSGWLLNQRRHQFLRLAHQGRSRHLGGPRQCLRVDILPDVRQFAVSNGNGEDPMVLKRPIRGFDSPRSEADDQNSGGSG